MNTFGEAVFNIILVALIVSGSACVGYVVGKDAVQKEAVEQGIAQYDPQTRGFEWLTIKVGER